MGEKTIDGLYHYSHPSSTCMIVYSCMYRDLKETFLGDRKERHANYSGTVPLYRLINADEHKNVFPGLGPAVS